MKIDGKVLMIFSLKEVRPNKKLSQCDIAQQLFGPQNYVYSYMRKYIRMACQIFHKLHTH